MNRFGIKLLVTLVLFILAATIAVTTSADARGLSGPGASNHFGTTRSGVGLAAGEPDAGSGGIAPQPPTNQKTLRETSSEGGGKVRGVLADWVQWTGRI